MTTLDEIADAMEAEWYGAPQLRDFHNQATNICSSCGVSLQVTAPIDEPGATPIAPALVRPKSLNRRSNAMKDTRLASTEAVA